MNHERYAIVVEKANRNYAAYVPESAPVAWQRERRFKQTERRLP